MSNQDLKDLDRKPLAAKCMDVQPSLCARRRSVALCALAAASAAQVGVHGVAAASSRSGLLPALGSVVFSILSMVVFSPCDQRSPSDRE